MTATDSGRRAATVRAGGLVAAAVMLGNVLGYALTLAAVRAMPPTRYGELAALLAVLLLGAIPMTALQVAVALRISRRSDATIATESLGNGLGLGLLLGAVTLAAAPGIAAVLRVADVASLLSLAVAIAGLTVAGAVQGVVQGQRRFVALALVLAMQAVGKVGGGLVGLSVVPRPGAVLAGTAAGILVATAAGWVIAVGWTGRLRPLFRPPVGFAASAASLGALFVVINLDLLLARNQLSAAAAGTYAAGAILAKATFWAPQAISTMALPHLTDGKRSKGVLRVSALLIIAVDGAVVLVCLVAADQVTRMVFGKGYDDVSSLLTWFALLGTAWALVQLLTYDALAAGRRSASAILWSAAATELLLVLVLRPSDPAGLLAIALTVAGAAAAAGGAVSAAEPARSSPPVMPV